MGLSHSPFVPNVFGVPAMDPRTVEYPGFSHSPYNYGNVYPFGYNAQSIPGWPTQYAGLPQTHVYEVVLVGGGRLIVFEDLVTGEWRAQKP
jgi:hypothetical protein